ncbi:hypothetical protein C0991_011444 [Blastosporella zonata]|nr:hypothetical protein C0991_011444 [Blastosporella zonata]
MDTSIQAATPRFVTMKFTKTLKRLLTAFGLRRPQGQKSTTVIPTSPERTPHADCESILASRSSSLRQTIADTVSQYSQSHGTVPRVDGNTSYSMLDNDHVSGHGVCLSICGSSLRTIPSYSSMHQNASNAIIRCTQPQGEDHLERAVTSGHLDGETHCASPPDQYLSLKRRRTTSVLREAHRTELEPGAYRNDDNAQTEHVYPREDNTIRGRGNHNHRKNTDDCSSTRQSNLTCPGAEQSCREGHSQYRNRIRAPPGNQPLAPHTHSTHTHKIRYLGEQGTSCTPSFDDNDYSTRASSVTDEDLVEGDRCYVPNLDLRGSWPTYRIDQEQVPSGRQIQPPSARSNIHAVHPAHEGGVTMPSNLNDVRSTWYPSPPGLLRNPAAAAAVQYPNYPNSMTLDPPNGSDSVHRLPMPADFNICRPPGVPETMPSATEQLNHQIADVIRDHFAHNGEHEADAEGTNAGVPSDADVQGRSYPDLSRNPPAATQYPNSMTMEMARVPRNMVSHTDFDGSRYPLSVHPQHLPPCLLQISSVSIGIRPLTILHVTNTLNLGTFLAVLRDCTCLQELVVVLSEDDSNDFSRCPFLVESSSLAKIMVSTSVEPLLLLSQVRLPRLKSLHIEWNEDCQHKMFPEADIRLLEFVTHSGCTLRDLVLLNILPYERDLTEVIKVQPSLERLSIRNDIMPALLPDAHGRIITNLTKPMLAPMVDLLKAEASLAKYNASYSSPNEEGTFLPIEFVSSGCLQLDV